MQSIAIIGAGFSGTVLAAHLLRLYAPDGRRVVLIERSGRFGRGVAYGTGCATHLLNVPAGRMSAFEDDPDHFLRWARERDPAVQGGSFLPRMVYGEYLGWVLDRAEATAAAGMPLERRHGAAVSVEQGPDRAAVVLASGERIAADRVVLALGNAAPGNPPTADPSFYRRERYIRDPWAAGRLDSVRPEESVLLIGTGLTMVDVALELAGRGHAGTIHAVSRRGLLPQPHRSPAKPHHPDPPPGLDSWEPTALGLLKALRREVERAAARGVDWREVVTSIRADTPRLWQSMILRERERFLHRVRAYWETHRHRAAPQAAAALAELVRAGRLRVAAARLRSFRLVGETVEATIRPRQQERDETLAVGRVINCTGPETDLAKLDDPLVRSLLASGRLVRDALALGAETSDKCEAVDSRGAASDRLFVCGPLRKAQNWENTAVPELRVEVAELARHLAAAEQPTIRVAAAAASSPAVRL